MHRLISLLACLLSVQASILSPGFCDGLVARKDYGIASSWTPRPILGRDFWHILLVNSQSHPDKGSTPQYWTGLAGKRLFTDCGFAYLDDGVKALVTPASGKVSLSTIDPKGLLELVDARPQAPFFVMSSSVRPTYRLMKHWECDSAGYLAWKAAHPNFMGWINGETDNDFLSGLARFQSKCEDAELLATVGREFPVPANREELTAQYLRACRAFREFCFNDAGKASYMRASFCLDHQGYESGPSVGVLETTNTGSANGLQNYRHQIGLYFARGAARQYRQEWMWYIASDLNGFNDQGKFGFSSPNYRTDKVAPCAFNGIIGPGCGMSTSLVTRDMFLAYLGGASFVAHEAWFHYLHPAAGKSWDLSSPLGQAWEDWFEFTRKHPERGASYAPVALLVPFEQGYPTYGGRSWQRFAYQRSDWMIDAFLFTIMPHSPVTRSGDEGALANSPYGDIYDVIVPNPPHGPVPLEVLNGYKVAALLGTYPKSEALTRRLMEYVANGGTLLLTIAQANEFFPGSFLGWKRLSASGVAAPSFDIRNPVRSLPDGTSFELPEPYAAEPVALGEATPLLVDAGGAVLASVNRYGNGRVIACAVDCLVPKNPRDCQVPDVLGKLVCGKRFPFVDYFLRNIVDEVLPLAVKGDIEYGLNRLPNGWLIYLINNKGVTKFTNREQALDRSKTARVEVSLKGLRAATITELRGDQPIAYHQNSHRFAVDVAPGDVRVLKITVASPD